jgi:hypothetical protein
MSRATVTVRRFFIGGCVMAKQKSDGQAMLEAWVAWISSWIVFPEAPLGSSLLMALWAMHTWFTPKWPVTTYVHVTSDGPGCGKSTLMQVLGALSLRPKLRVTMRALSVVRDIEQSANACTYFFDQVEALNAPRITDETSILLSGYEDSGRHGVSVGQREVSFSTYCAKMFACIGAIHPDLRSRTVVVRLTFGAPMRVWSDEVMVRGGEAARLLEMAADWFGSKGFAMRQGVIANAPAWVPTPGFTGRDRQVYTPLWSVAQALELDEETLAAVATAMHDHVAFKQEVEQRSYRDLRAERGEGADERERGDAVQALRDLVSVLPVYGPTTTGNIWSETAVERLKALPITGGKWRMYRGRGLDAVTLAALLRRFEVEDGQTLGGGADSNGGALVRETRGRKGVLRRGYYGRDVRAALARLEAAQAMKGGA